MAVKDIVEKHLEEYDDVFADIVNVLLFDGKTVVKESELENGLAKSQYKADTSKVHEQERDVVKFWKDGNVKIAIYGLENQTLIDKDMPLRIIGYDGQSYRSQLLADKNKKLQGRYPVVTLVLYFGLKRWEGNRSLYDILEIPEGLKPYVSDYKTNVFEIAYLEQEQVDMFQSDFKYVADYFVQMRRDKDYVPSTETMEHVDAVLKAMSVLTNDSRFVEAWDSAERSLGSMCEVLDRVEQRGIEKGIEKGIVKGIEKGREQGIEKGVISLVETLKELGQTNEFILEKIMEKFALTETEAKKFIP